jgi:hypothetical protein
MGVRVGGGRRVGVDGLLDDSDVGDETSRIDKQ